MDKKFFDNTIIAQYAVTGVPLKVYVDSRYLTITDADDVENPIIGHGMEPNGEMEPFSYQDIDHLLVADNIIDLETYNTAMADQFKPDEPEEAPEGDEEAPEEEGEEGEDDMPAEEEEPAEEVPEEEPTTEEGIEMTKLNLSEALPPHMDPSWGALLTVSIPVIAKLLYDLGIKNKDDIKKFIQKLKDESPKQESVYETINGITEISKEVFKAKMNVIKKQEKELKDKETALKKEPIDEARFSITGMMSDLKKKARLSLKSALQKESVNEAKSPSIVVTINKSNRYYNDGPRDLSGWYAKEFSEYLFGSKYNLQVTDLGKDQFTLEFTGKGLSNIDSKVDDYVNRLNNAWKGEGLKISLDESVNESVSYLYDPHRLIDAALRMKWISEEEARQPETKRTAKEQHDDDAADQDPDGDFGSSDFSYSLMYFMEKLGYEMDVKNGKIVKVEESVNESRKFTPGDKYSPDFDYEGMLAAGLKVNVNTPIELLNKLFDSFTDVNYHTEAKGLGIAIDYIEDGDKNGAIEYMDMFHKAVKGDKMIKESEILSFDDFKLDEGILDAFRKSKVKVKENTPVRLGTPNVPELTELAQKALKTKDVVMFDYDVVGTPLAGIYLVGGGAGYRQVGIRTNLNVDGSKVQQFVCKTNGGPTVTYETHEMDVPSVFCDRKDAQKIWDLYRNGELEQTEVSVNEASDLPKGPSKAGVKRLIKDVEEMLDTEIDANGDPLTNETEMILQKELKRLKALLRESVNEGRDDVTFTLDDGDLDDKFLSDKSLSRNLDYIKDGRDTYYVLPKRDFDRLQDWADSSGYDTDEVIYVVEESLNEDVSSPYIYQVGDLVQNVNPTCPHHGSKGIVMSVEPEELTYSVTNSGDTFKPGARLTKTLDQLEAI
jgi:hypothetical protein